jgi:hypothetical protein
VADAELELAAAASQSGGQAAESALSIVDISFIQDASGP